MQQLRKAGKYLLDKDQQYAQAVATKLGKHAGGPVGFVSTVPLRDTLPNPADRADTRAEKVALAAMSAGVGAANVGTRYALPAAGVTLAGKGLYDLTMQLAYGGQADQQERGQLKL